MLTTMILRLAHKIVARSSPAIVREPHWRAVSQRKLNLKVGNILLAFGNGQKLHWRKISWW